MFVDVVVVVDADVVVDERKRPPRRAAASFRGCRGGAPYVDAVEA
jgi:hypothetical protein